MARKTAVGKYPRRSIPCERGKDDEEKGRKVAELLTSGEFAAWRLVGMMAPPLIAPDVDNPTLIEVLRGQAAAVQGGDMRQVEAMLINQASALQALFARLTERAMEQTHHVNLEMFMRLALRAQSQCRATLETLSTVKNPPVVYARQANIANGPQQINNGVAPPSQAREITSEQAELSGETHELLPDARASQAASRIDTPLEALDQVHRAEDA